MTKICIFASLKEGDKIDEVVRISDEGIKQYNSIIEAAQDNGVDPSNIVKCCKGKQNTCGGYLWAYSKKR